MLFSAQVQLVANFAGPSFNKFRKEVSSLNLKNSCGWKYLNTTNTIIFENDIMNLHGA